MIKTISYNTDFLLAAPAEDEISCSQGQEAQIKSKDRKKLVFGFLATTNIQRDIGEVEFENYCSITICKTLLKGI